MSNLAITVPSLDTAATKAHIEIAIAIVVG
jgi:hypothetical protein